MSEAITKAALARELKISKARVSQYVASGLPVLEDGRLDREQALAWIANNIDPGQLPSRGAARAFALSSDTPQRYRMALPAYLDFVHARKLKPYDAGAAIMGVELAYRLPSLAAAMAAHAGVPMRVTFSLWARLDCAAMTEVMAAMRRFGVELGNTEHAEAIWMMDNPLCRPNWENLAQAAGEPCDLAAWEAYHLEKHRGEMTDSEREAFDAGA